MSILSLGFAAVEWARRGIPVFPLHDTAGGRCSCHSVCHRPAKHPRVRWQDAATTDLRTIREWWRRWPSANIGGSIGAAGVFVVDVDGRGGRESLASWEATCGPLRPTYAVRSGRIDGGEHRWYTADRPIRNRQGVLPGVDVRGIGGYVVLPPSWHASGRPYRALSPYSALAPAPAALLDLVIGEASSEANPEPAEWMDAEVTVPERPWWAVSPARATDDRPRRRVWGMVGAACRRIEAAERGERHRTLVRECYRIGGYLECAGMTEEDVAAALIEAGHVCGASDPERHVGDGLRAGLAAPRELP